ncbi:MAG: hypothetical protein AB9900_11055 [Humidesulfovibrio sp.]
MVAEATASSTALSGMTAICTYVGRSEKTVLDWIRFEAMPASKIGGVWESDKELIDDWRRKRIVAGTREESLRERAR